MLKYELVQFLIYEILKIKEKKLVRTGKLHAVLKDPNSISQTSATIAKGATLSLTYSSMMASFTGNEVTWKSSNKKIASVSASGNSVIVTGKKKGSVKITATYRKYNPVSRTWKKWTKTCKVKVLAKPAADKPGGDDVVVVINAGG